jgi:hypothetical protein
VTTETWTVRVEVSNEQGARAEVVLTTTGEQAWRAYDAAAAEAREPDALSRPAAGTPMFPDRVQPEQRRWWKFW